MKGKAWSTLNARRDGKKKTFGNRERSDVPSVDMVSMLVLMFDEKNKRKQMSSRSLRVFGVTFFIVYLFFLSRLEDAASRRDHSNIRAGFQGSLLEMGT